MALDPDIKSRLTLPAICAPMARVTNPALIIEVCKQGLIGSLQPGNARDPETAETWLAQIRGALDKHKAEHPDAKIGPLAVNMRLNDRNAAEWEVLTKRYGVEIFITMAADPTESIRWAHSWGAKVFHDVINIRFAEKAISAGADGLTAVCAGGGGHAGTLSPLSYIPRLRSMFEGTIVMGGGVATGAAIRAGELLGADLAYIGTRFIATKESAASDEYKQLLLDENSDGLLYTDGVSGLAASWLMESMRRVGLDPRNLPPRPEGRISYSHLPAGARPWNTFWSAGHGIDLMHDVPSVAELVSRLRRDYIAAHNAPSMLDAARLAEQAQELARAL